MRARLPRGIPAVTALVLAACARDVDIVAPGPPAAARAAARGAGGNSGFQTLTLPTADFYGFATLPTEPCLGEAVALGGTASVRVRQREVDGVTRLDGVGPTSLSDVTVTGVSTGTEYRAENSGFIHLETASGAPRSVAHVEQLRISGGQPGAHAILKHQWHLVTDANGNVRVDRDELTLRCKGVTIPL
jgi:hypothetical protein